MRLRVGLVLATIAIVCVLSAVPASWYHVNVVGPNFVMAMEMGVPDPLETEEIREIDGQWSLWDYQITNSSFRPALPEPDLYDDPMFVSPLTDDAVQVPNANAIEVYEDTVVVMSTAIIALAIGAFGAWNIARYDRYRMFTAASFLLAGLLLIGACYHFGTELPGAMEKDSQADFEEEAFGLPFEAYLNTEGGVPAYYTDFAGGYPDSNPEDREQLTYGPGSGWWMSGAGGILALITAGVLFGAPQWAPLKRRAPETREVLRYVPVPTVAALRRRRNYPKKMPAMNRTSPGRPRRPT
jgi:hypothetical protein